MRILVQRCLNASVEVDNKIVGKIDRGYLILVGFTHTDNESTIDYLINKLLKLRIFDDEFGIMNKSILDMNYDILSVSQFTLYANTKEGNRPSYKESLNSNEASILYDLFNKKLSQYIKVETGIFGSDMKVSLTNDGPVTIMLEK
ncbi:MAG: D-tyrosyl-tRNA(Tyr) deacylase [Bacilli bacterium]|nr:D-tyrosyl-tRNA(Tyr) deacylase [Bacilli bacterium]